jgi:hypothetical protein
MQLHSPSRSDSTTAAQVPWIPMQHQRLRPSYDFPLTIILTSHMEGDR